MLPVPLILPTLSRADAAASRRRSAPRSVLTLWNGSLKLTLTGIGARTPAKPELSVFLNWGGNRLILQCPADLPVQILLALGSDLQFPALPTQLAALLLEAALLPGIAALEQATGRGFGIEDIGRNTQSESARGLLLLLDGGTVRWPIHVTAARGGDFSVLDTLLDFWPVAPLALDRFTIPAALRIGVTRMTAGDLSSLRPDDAVLLDTRLGDGAMLVIAEAWTAVTRHDARGWHLAAVPGRAQASGTMEWTMQEGAIEGEPRPLADEDELPVTLSFDVGRLEITLGTLRRLGIGSVLEIGRGTSELVRISANGRLVGHGELVDVGGATAVRIVRLFEHG